MILLEENWDAPEPKHYDGGREHDERSWYDKLKDLIGELLFGK